MVANSVTIPAPIVSIGRALLDFVYPPHCCACRCSIASASDILCGDCRSQISSAAGGPACQRCYCPSEQPVQHCHHCSLWQEVPERVLVMGSFEGALQTSIHALKFGRKRQLAKEVGRIFAGIPCFAADFREIDLFVPIPLHPSRHRERSYNQSELIAAGLASRLGKPLRCDLVHRARATAQQATLDAARRRDNLNEAFEVAAIPPSGARIGLVDDVVTTAATMGSCARALLDGGAGAVWGVALASPFQGPGGLSGARVA